MNVFPFVYTKSRSPDGTVIIKRINLKSPLHQYLTGLIINLLYLIIIFSSDTAYRNIQIPEGRYGNNLWHTSDVLTYVNPARNFLQTGVVGEGQNPDYCRTVGYPLYLALMMTVFGKHWLLWTLILQAFLFAFIYPVMTKMIGLLFGDRKHISAAAFLFFIFSGVYFTRLPMLYNDLLFTIIFTIGLYFGLRAIANLSWRLLILQVVFIGAAAQIRPNLVFYFMVNIFVLWSVGKLYGTITLRKAKQMILVSTILLLTAGSAPSLRNYVNYGIFKPTNIFENNLLHFLGEQVLRSNNESDRYREITEKLGRENNFIERMKMERRFALEIYKKYPLSTLKHILIPNAMATLASNHIIKIFNFWGYHWRSKALKEREPLKGSDWLFALNLFYGLVYVTVYILFLLALTRMVRKRQYLYAGTTLMFVLYFLLPTFPAGVGRLRLPVEGIFVIFGFNELHLRWQKFKSKNE